MKIGVALLVASFPAHAIAAQLTITNTDGPGEGLNDSTPATSVGGNPGTTIGEQRMRVLEAAAQTWSAALAMTVDVEVDASFDALPCTVNTAVIGQGGATAVSSNFLNATPNRWYPAALANQVAGSDLNGATSEIELQINVNLGSASCFSGRPFYLGLDGAAPMNSIDLLSTALHELAHGLGFFTVVDLTNGARPSNMNDVFMVHLEDHSSARGWGSMTNAQRLASSIDTGDLHWTGANAVGAAATILTGGTGAGGHVLMYAPNPLEPGSSVSHFDESAAPDQALEPVYNGPTTTTGLTRFVLQDIGWNLIAALCGNGMLESGEQCDDGNTANGDCCSATCAIEADGTPCPNGLVCDGGETCLNGSCVSSMPLVCDDLDACTHDACVEPTGCMRTNIPGCCNVDADCPSTLCATGVCSGTGGMCSFVSIPGCCLVDADCPSMGCRAGICSNPGGMCSLVPIPGCCASNAECNDGVVCTSDQCDFSSMSCVFTPVPDCCTFDMDCDDGFVCTDDSCDEATGVCSHVPLSGNGCCSTNAECDDNDVCTRDRCNLMRHSCRNRPQQNCCHDDSECMAPICMVSGCNASNRCDPPQPIPDCCTSDSECDDGDACTLDQCRSNACMSTPIPGCGAADAGPSDTGARDTGVRDAGRLDSDVPDSGVPDSGDALDGSMSSTIAPGLLQTVEPVGCGCTTEHGRSSTSGILLLVLMAVSVLSRRRVRLAFLLVPLTITIARAAYADVSLTLDSTISAEGPDHERVAFTVPSGIAEVEIEHDDRSGDDILDWGLEDPAGFRGWGGGNTENAVVNARAASRSYLSGPITSGPWNVVIGRAKISHATVAYRLRVILRETATLEPQLERAPYEASAALASGARWYVGDLHVHSRESGDASPTLDTLGTFARSQGLDFIELSDHNTTSQLDFIRDAQARHPELLFIPGVEFTTYDGHANGIGATRFVDHKIGQPGVTIEGAARAFHEQGALFSINHPLLDLGDRCIGCAWKHELPFDQIDAVEIATAGAAALFIESTLAFWEEILDSGRHVAPVGGSDDHDAGQNLGTFGTPVGTPATLVFAEELSAEAIVRGIERGRTVVKLHGPSDPMIDLTSGDARPGDTIRAARASLRARITGGKELTARWVINGRAERVVSIDSDDFELVRDVTVTVGRRDRYRAEVLSSNIPTTITGHLWIEGVEEEKSGCACTGERGAREGRSGALFTLILFAGALIRELASLRTASSRR